MRRHRHAVQDWDPSDLPAWLTREGYVTQIRPALARVAKSQIRSRLRYSDGQAHPPPPALAGTGRPRESLTRFAQREQLTLNRELHGALVDSESDKSVLINEHRRCSSRISPSHSCLSLSFWVNWSPHWSPERSMASSGWPTTRELTRFVNTSAFYQYQSS